HEGHAAHEVVEVLDVAIAATAVQDGARAGDGAGEPRTLAEDRGEVDQIGGARVVAGRIEPDRVRVVRVAQAEPPSGAVHQGHEGALRARGVAGEVPRRGV